MRIRVDGVVYASLTATADVLGITPRAALAFATNPKITLYEEIDGNGQSVLSRRPKVKLERVSILSDADIPIKTKMNA